MKVFEYTFMIAFKRLTFKILKKCPGNVEIPRPHSGTHTSAPDYFGH